MKKVSSRHRRPAHRPLTGFEQLETRSVLSANVIPAASFDLAIRGTDVQFSPLGLPSAMGGDIYLAAGAARSQAAIGRYQESLAPILMDINDDQVPDFVGTHGVATFTFFVGGPQHTFGSITTADVSYIQGITPAGQLQVGSQGTIVGASGPLAKLSGGFVSQSVVGLAPTFDMQTNVHFTVNRPVGKMFNVRAMAENLESSKHRADTQPAKNDTGGPSHHGDADDTRGDDDRQNNDSFHVGKPHANFGQHDAHDMIFGENLDWLPGKADDLAVV
jgi:hypothetical protein